MFLAELRTRRRRPKESLQELGQSIRELTALAHQEFDEAGQERLARCHFMDAVVRPEVRGGGGGLFRAQPRTLDDAIEAALSTEAFLRMETERNDSRSQRYSRALTDDGVEQKSKSTKDADDAVSKLTKAVEKLISRSLCRSDYFPSSLTTQENLSTISSGFSVWGVMELGNPGQFGS